MLFALGGNNPESSGDVMSCDDHSPFSQPNLVGSQSSQIEPASEDGFDQILPTNLQGPERTTKVPLNDVESISLSDVMHPSHDVARGSGDSLHGEMNDEHPITPVRSNMPLWDILEISQSTFNYL
jgi:hypothetical protein